MNEREVERAEQDRVVAEEGRVVAEGERVHAEGAEGHEPEQGRVQAEEERVDAEAARVASEEARAQSAKETYRHIAVLIALPIAFIALIPSIVGLIVLSREIDDRCVDSTVNREAIRSSVTAGFTALGYKLVDGSAVETEEGPIDYYLTRPAERGAALQRTLATLEAFPPINCGNGWFS